MILEFVFQHGIMCGILLCGIVSIFMQWMMTLSLTGYVKASANMDTTKKKIMINLKKQFETMHEMNCHVNNVEAYVEKYLLKLRFMGLSFSLWERVPALSVGVVSLIAGGTAFYTYTTEGTASTYIEIIFSYGVVLACFFLFFHIFGIKSKKQQMLIQLVDYLENYLANRVARTQEISRDSKVSDLSAQEAFADKEKKPEESEQMLPDGEKEIAAAEEMTEVEMLEEFVQSFLA